MSAMAELIEYYGWRQVIAIFVDDEYGRNGISVLGDELAKRKSSIYYKIALPLRASPSRIADLLDKSKFMGRRVYVVHVSPDSGIDVFTIAYKLQMMTDGFVWLTTDWLCTALDSSASTKIKSFEYLQGVVSFCPYIPQSHQNSTFMYKWSSKLNKYGLYAYDTVWAVAHAIDEYLNGSGNITFSHSNTMRDMRGKIQLDRLKIFDGGKMLLNKLLQVNFTGLTGTVRFNLERNRITTAYEIINIDREEIHTVGYWTHHLGFTNVPPKMSFESGHRNLIVDRNLGNVTWPGGKKEIPRGWVLSGNDKVLRVGVPNRASYIAFSTESKSTHKIEGYCIDVFKAALKYIPYAVPYRFVPVGDGLSNPNYDELVNMVAENIIDAAVGDIAIVTNRTKAVDFTQPYAATGLVVVAPIRISKSSTWVFLKPFTVQMWCVTLAFFILIGVVIWVLEHRVNSDFRGPPRQQLITMFLFSFSTLFKTQQENTSSVLGRMVMMVWLFLLMVITASYTASLTSILTVQQLSSPIKGIDSLIASNEPIGYQVGSFAHNYLTDCLNVRNSRLVPLGTPEAYSKALKLGPKNGGVAAIVDELPYVELFLSNITDFCISGQMFTKNGWGFAFQRDSPLAIDMSTAILKLSEVGGLQKIHDEWFCKKGCAIDRRDITDPNQLHINSFWGLFLLSGIATLTAFLVFLMRSIRQFVRYNKSLRESSSSPETEPTRCTQSIHKFIDFIDEREEAVKNIFRQQQSSQPEIS
ncbi:Glutamate receptor 3.7 [Acorus calamus]|uniref:Glutamate receptor 3.7 n=1 Tax=Acorus calamus TaxID=4465 RepID=A0AAV9FLV7_ACOCL|nr:Glutamate receptor 3.7 [Acorus calamus]